MEERVRARGVAVLVTVVAGLLSSGCAVVRPWQREALSLAPMQVGDDPVHRFEHNTEVYREGALGANGGKSGGGCGCS